MDNKQQECKPSSDNNWLIDVLDELTADYREPGRTICDTCGKPVSAYRMLIIWRESGGAVQELKLVHKLTCDDKALTSSGGAAYGPDWSAGSEWARFEKKKFARQADSEKLFSALRRIEREARYELR